MYLVVNAPLKQDQKVHPTPYQLIASSDQLIKIIRKLVRNRQQLKAEATAQKMISSISSIFWGEPSDPGTESDNIEDDSSDGEELVVVGPSCKAEDEPETAMKSMQNKRKILLKGQQKNILQSFTTKFPQQNRLCNSIFLFFPVLDCEGLFITFTTKAL